MSVGLTPDSGAGRLLLPMKSWPQRLLDWYATHKRAMPWRGHPDPYAVWVSEIMLQQTRVDTVRPYFLRFLSRFPSISDLARAPMEDLLKAWEGLGYYSRARNLQAAARAVASIHGGRLPRSSAELERLPGIGPYTAAAIASICFNEPAPVVDGNVARVFSRMLGWSDDFAKPASRRKLAAWIAPHFPQSAAPGDLNQAMMELGALICAPQAPNCPACPLRSSCHACRTGTQDAFPFRPMRAAIPTRYEAAVLIRRRGRLLLSLRRSSGRLLDGFWELPAVSISRSPPKQALLAKRVSRQTGLRLGTLVAVGERTHVFTHFRLHLRVFACARAVGRLRTGSANEYRWAGPREISRLPVSTAHRRVLERFA